MRNRGLSHRYVCLWFLALRKQVHFSNTVDEIEAGVDVDCVVDVTVDVFHGFLLNFIFAMLSLTV